MGHPFRRCGRLCFEACAFTSLLLTAALACMPARAAASSDDVKRDLDATGATIKRAAVDPRIAEALSRISAAQIQHTIEMLVSFTLAIRFPAWKRTCRQARV